MYEVLDNLCEDLSPYREVILSENTPSEWQHKDHIKENRNEAPEVEQKHNLGLMKR